MWLPDQVCSLPRTVPSPPHTSGSISRQGNPGTESPWLGEVRGQQGEATPVLQPLVLLQGPGRGPLARIDEAGGPAHRPGMGLRWKLPGHAGNWLLGVLGCRVLQAWPTGSLCLCQLLGP